MALVWLSWRHDVCTVDVGRIAVLVERGVGGDVGSDVSSDVGIAVREKDYEARDVNVVNVSRTGQGVTK